MEKRSSEEEMDMTEAYTDKPVQEHVSTSVLTYDVTFCIIFFNKNIKKFFRVWSWMYFSYFLSYCILQYRRPALTL